MSLLINAERQRTATIAEFANLLKSDDPIPGALIARATVVALEPTGTSVFLGGVEHHFCRVTLQVSLPGFDPYPAVCSHKLTATTIGRIRARVIPDAVPVVVQVDPDEHLHVCVDWSAVAG